MAVDYDAREMTLNYDGGSITSAIGNFKSLFGDDEALLHVEPATGTRGVIAHKRTRVIGGPQTNVKAYDYDFKQFPTSQAGLAAGGTIIYMDWDDSDGEWTARVSGPMSALGDFFNEVAPKAVVFRTERGTKYGPFIKIDLSVLPTT